MRTINVHRLQLQFDVDAVNTESDEMLAEKAIDMINLFLSHSNLGMIVGPQLIAHRDEIEVEGEKCES